MLLLRRAGCSALAAIALAAGSISVPAAASAAPSGDRPVPPGAVRTADRSAIKDSYLVGLKDAEVAGSEVDASAARLVKQHGGTVTRTFRTALRGFAVRMSAAQAAKLATSSEVAFVEQNRTVSKSDTIQFDVPSWGLDRLDQIFAPLNKRFTYPNTASDVNAYVIDTGIRTTHAEFEGRAGSGWDFIDNDATAQDCDGHGTHVAGTIGGRTYGVAKGVHLVGVRVLDCVGKGTTDSVVAGIEWVTANAVKPAVVNVSLSGEASTAIDTAVQASIASGLTYAVAAGNEWDDACGYSPSRVTDAITVGATDEADFRAAFSNFGACVDINAPGHHIPSPIATDDTAIGKYSGTSSASAHVAGAAALVLSANPAWTPAQVRNNLVFGGTRRVVRNTAAYATTDVILRIGTNVVPQVTGLRSLVNGKNISVGATGNSPVQPVSAPATMGDPEKFTTAAAGTGGWYTFASWVNGRYLSVSTGQLVAGASTVTDAERFQPSINGDGTVSLLSKLTGRYVTVPNNGNSPLTATATAIGQAEKFIWASPSAVVVLRADVNDKLVTAPSGSPLIAGSTVATPTNAEKFDMLDLGNDTVAFRSYANRQFVTSPATSGQPLVANSTTIGVPQQFWYYHWGDGTLGFQSLAGDQRLVAAPNNGNSALTATGLGAAIHTSFYYEVLKVG